MNNSYDPYYDQSDSKGIQIVSRVEIRDKTWCAGEMGRELKYNREEKERLGGVK